MSRPGHCPTTVNDRTATQLQQATNSRIFVQKIGLVQDGFVGEGFRRFPDTGLTSVNGSHILGEQLQGETRSLYDRWKIARSAERPMDGKAGGWSSQSWHNP